MFLIRTHLFKISHFNKLYLPFSFSLSFFHLLSLSLPFPSSLCFFHPYAGPYQNANLSENQAVSSGFIIFFRPTPVKSLITPNNHLYEIPALLIFIPIHHIHLLQPPKGFNLVLSQPPAWFIISLDLSFPSLLSISPLGESSKYYFHNLEVGLLNYLAAYLGHVAPSLGKIYSLSNQCLLKNIFVALTDKFAPYD